MGLAEAV